jgi:hypothetical protein
MDNINHALESTEQPKKTRANSNKKRKWREIESLRDKFKLEKDLKECGGSLEYMLEDF